MKRLVFNVNLMILAANVGTWRRPCVCFVDGRLEAFGCQEEVYLVVNLSIRGMPGCYPRQLLGVESVSKGDSLRTLRVSLLCRLFLQCQIFLLSVPNVAMCKGLLWHSNRLELQIYPS